VSSNRKVPPWYLKGSLVGACNCDWGCPCNFEAPPSYGFCDGFSTIAVHEGRFGNLSLDGVKFLMGGHTPGAIHQGDGTSILIIDEATTPEQRDAVQALWRGGGVGSPFDEFASVTTVWFDPVVASIEIKLDGMNSTVRVAGGDIYDLALTSFDTSGKYAEISYSGP